MSLNKKRRRPDGNCIESEEFLFGTSTIFLEDFSRCSRKILTVGRVKPMPSFNSFWHRSKSTRMKSSRTTWQLCVCPYPRQGYLFENEITDEIAPKYHQFIRRPIALHTIRKTLESNEYPSKDHFKRDIYLMLYNAMKYNPRFHHVHRSAKHLFQLALPLFDVLPFSPFSLLSPLSLHSLLVFSARHSRTNHPKEFDIGTYSHHRSSGCQTETNEGIDYWNRSFLSKLSRSLCSLQ